MRKRRLLIIAMLSAIVSAAAAADHLIPVGKGCVQVTFYSPGIVRIVKTPGTTVPQTKSLAVTMQPQDVKTKRTESGGNVTIAAGDMSVSVDKQTGCVTFAQGGRQLLAEQPATFKTRTDGPDKGSYEVAQAFTLDGDEPIYGLGILQDGKMNRRGTHRLMIQANTEDYQNVIQSLKGWGLYWDNYSPTDFTDDANGMSFASQVGDAVDYYFMYGGSADGVVAKVRQLTGSVPMLPKWTFGYWQSKERYRSFDELKGVVAKYRELGVPLDGIVQDWQYWGSHYLWNAMEFFGEGFGNPEEAIGDIHKANARLMISIWASFGPHTKAYRTLSEQGHLFNFSTWPTSGIESQWPPRLDYPSGVRCYDPFSSEARDVYWDNLRRLYDLGIDGWWMDSTEPDNFDMTDADFDVPTGLGSLRRVRNAYPLMTVGGVYDHQRAVSGDKRVFIMTRSGFAGQQRYGANVWSGDVGASWETLRNQIPAGLNFTLTGNPNYNTDIGGFFAGSYNTKEGYGSACRNPQYQELYVRWMQYGLFCPVFRSHGTEVPREIYNFGKKGEPVYDAIEKTIRLRYRLIPYIYSTAWQVTSADGSYLRPLVCDFPEDSLVWDMGHEFMFGRSILAAPVVNAQYTPEKTVDVDAMSGWDKKEGDGGAAALTADFTKPATAQVYLPRGTQWYDFHTGKLYDGGRDISIATTLDLTPMFVRAGSIVPVGEEKQWVDERPDSVLEMRVYPGADGTFTLYDDAGDGYGYEQGVRSEITFTWSDRRRTFTIGQRKGSYPGMLQTRSFNVVLPDGTARTVSYTGKKTSVKM